MSATPAPSRAVRALFVLVVVLGGLAAAEIAGRVAYSILDRSRAGMIGRIGALHSYEMLDPANPRNWRVKPNLALTLADAREIARSDGLLLAIQALERGAARLGVPEDRVVFTSNAEGYKGPPLDRSGARPRLLAIGDSCTFGSLFEYYTWPRSAERAFAALGTPVEVVNAGVNGYSPVNAVARLDEFQALDPQIAVIYIGWNALFGDRRTVEGEFFALHRLMKTLYSLWWTRNKTPQEIALHFYESPKRPDRDAANLDRLAAYRPAFLSDVETLIRGLQDGGAQVWVATLPGLYVLDETPSAHALQFGHLPQWTDNPYVIAAMAQSYNEGLRELAARTSAGLIDLDRWSRQALVPRDESFIDTVHLTEEGQEQIGFEVARVIAPSLPPPSRAHADRSERR